LIEATFHLYEQVNVIGDYLRLTYIHNPGAAFGIQFGPPGYSRFIFLGLSVIALIALAGMYWVTPQKDRVRLSAIALICAGAIGNLLDRVRSSAGVVDFLDVGIGDLRWPVFNVADIAVTTGAVFLALSRRRRVIRLTWARTDRRVPGPSRPGAVPLAGSTADRKRSCPPERCTPSQK
jgi:signal peptidase II